MDDASANEVLDEGLTRLAVTGPEFRGGLSNHGPMAAEAMVRLGRADAVEGWLDDYLGRLDAPPAALRGVLHVVRRRGRQEPRPAACRAVRRPGRSS